MIFRTRRRLSTFNHLVICCAPYRLGLYASLLSYGLSAFYCYQLHTSIEIDLFRVFLNIGECVNIFCTFNPTGLTRHKSCIILISDSIHFIAESPKNSDWNRHKYVVQCHSLRPSYHRLYLQRNDIFVSITCFHRLKHLPPLFAPVSILNANFGLVLSYFSVTIRSYKSIVYHELLL